jgi:hypothetical protein
MKATANNRPQAMGSGNRARLRPIAAQPLKRNLFARLFIALILH